MPVYSLIKKRRSTRSFLDKDIPYSKIRKILDAGRWAPSGLNNQPWRFLAVKDKALKAEISNCTEYSYIIKRANYLILVFLDKDNSYDRVKDAQAIGACIQNMLLAAREEKIYSCWIGQILNKKSKVNKLLSTKLPRSIRGMAGGLRYELMAAIALGYSNKKSKSRRTCLDKLILGKFL